MNSPVTRGRAARLALPFLLSFLLLSCLLVLTWHTFAPDGHDGKHGGAIDLAAAAEAPRPHIRSSFSPHATRDDARARVDWELMRLRDPSTGRIPPNARARDVAFAQALRADAVRSGKAGSGSAAASWTLRGPVNVGGRTRALAIDLDYNGASNQRIIAGGISGGMYLSEDDGQTWVLTSSLNDHASVTTVAQDPSSRNVWYYGTGEINGNSASGSGAFFYGTGIFKSTNSGVSWSLLSSTSNGDLFSFDNTFDRVRTVAVHPTNGDVYAAIHGQIVRSKDGGTSWVAVLESDPNLVRDTDVHIASDGDVYAVLGRSGSGNSTYGIFYSSSGDAGSFTNISPPTLANDPYRIVLNSSPSDPATVYAFVQATPAGDTAADHQLFRYNEGSGSWSDLSSSIPNEAGLASNASMSTQGGYDQIVVVHPTNSNTVFIGGTNLYRSTDGGQNFTRIGGYLNPNTYGQFDGHHSDQHALVFYPNDANRALSGSDGGVSLSTNILATPHTWTYRNAGYLTSQFYGVGIDPQAGADFVVGGLQDNGTWATESANGQTNWISLFSGDGGFSHVAPGAGKVYITAQLGTAYRVTAPSSYSNIAPAGASDYQFIVPNVLDPNDARVMYIAEAGGVWRNSNLDGIPEGNSDPTSINWTFLSGSAQPGHKTTAVSASTSPGNRIYFGTTNFSSSTQLIRVDDAAGNGAGTAVMPPVTSSGLPPVVSDIAINPSNGDEVVAVFSNYGVESLWHSTNAGESWTNIGGNLGGVTGPSIRSAVIVPTNSGTVVVVGTSVGVYSATGLSGGSTNWTPEGGSLIGNVVVNQVISRPADGTVVVGTHGRGVYQATIQGGGGGSAQAATNVTSLTINATLSNTPASTTFELSNAGAGTLNYTIGTTESAAQSVELGPPTREIADHLEVIRQRKQDSPSPGISSSTASVKASKTSSGDFLIFDDGNETQDQFVGWGDGGPQFQWLNSFVSPAGGFLLESVLVFMNTGSQSSNELGVFITDPQGNEFISGTVSLSASSGGEWYEVTFDPIQMDEGVVFDVEFLAANGISFPAGADFDGQVTDRSYFWDAGSSSYLPLSGQTNFTNGAFMIRSQGTAAGSQTRLTASPTNGSLGAGQSQTVTVTYDPSGLSAGGSFSGSVEIAGNGGNISLPVTINVVPVANEPGDTLPTNALHAAYPNPFSDQATIPYAIEEAARVNIAIFDVEGRLVRELRSGSQAPGEHAVVWDGLNSARARVASGTYFVRMESVPESGGPGSRQTRTVVLRK